jgi:hypothetical protein
MSQDYSGTLLFRLRWEFFSSSPLHSSKHGTRSIGASKDTVTRMTRVEGALKKPLCAAGAYDPSHRDARNHALQVAACSSSSWVEVVQSSVSKHVVKRRGPLSQGWRTFLRSHAPSIAVMHLFVVPTIGFDLLYAFAIVRPDRRNLVWINVTAHPTAEWLARQMMDALPGNEAPRYMIRDRDCICGAVVTRRLRAMGIRDKPTAPASPKR